MKTARTLDERVEKAPRMKNEKRVNKYGNVPCSFGIT